MDTITVIVMKYWSKDNLVQNVHKNLFFYEIDNFEISLSCYIASTYVKIIYKLH